MEKKELHPIILEESIESIEDILVSSEDLKDIYSPEVSCSGAGAAACKDGCISGCKDTSKSGGNCTESCQEGCKEGCKKSCKSGNK